MDAATFDFPTSVTRSTDLSASASETRTGHHLFAPLTPAEVERGRAVFAAEWRRALSQVGVAASTPPDEAIEFEAMDLLRRPVARATCAAVLTGLDEALRDHVADLVLAWIDALAPVIASRRAPRRWSRTRRAEHQARIELEQALSEVLGECGIADSAAVVATMLAAGIQVPIAAGAWLLVHLAGSLRQHLDPDHVVWETLRISPPTWITARVTIRPVEFGGHQLPSGVVVLVSPLLLGRRPELAPDTPAGLDAFCPERWRRDDVRPGAWLPFGAGAHACPGRTLGLALLRDLAVWAGPHRMTLVSSVTIDQSRGILPRPASLAVELWEGSDS
jgi:cytochrome P450